MYQEKLTYALVGVIVGFVVNKVYDSIARWVERTRIKKGLVEELNSVLHDLSNLKDLCEERIQRSDSYHEGDFPRQIKAPIFDKYYADICLFLNPSQRTSFEKIYIIIEELNEFISTFFKKRCENACLLTCKKELATNYATICDLIFLVNNHIEYQKYPINIEQVNIEISQSRNKVNEFMKKNGLVPE